MTQNESLTDEAAEEIGRLLRAYIGKEEYDVSDIRQAWDLVDRLESAETPTTAARLPEPGDLMLDTDRRQSWGTDRVEVVEVLDEPIENVSIGDQSVFSANHGRYPRNEVCVVARYADDNQGSTYHFPLQRLKPLDE